MRAIDKIILKVLLRIKARDEVPAVSETDEEVWRTSKEGHNAGRHYKIETETGEIKAGFGGKLNGVKAVPKAQRQSSNSTSKAKGMPKVDPLLDPMNAEPQGVTDVMLSKRSAWHNALKEYRKELYSFNTSFDKRDALLQAVKDAKADYDQYAEQARQRPDYLEKVYKSTAREYLETSGIENREIKPYTTQPTQNEIINRLGGGDETEGSCASLAYAYCGCTAGLDVLDYRDGESREFFSANGEAIVHMDGVSTQDFKQFKGDIPNGKAALRAVESGKEYLLRTGRHAAIVRKTESGQLQYLELQSATNNGWTNFNKDLSYTLKYRFGGGTFRRAATLTEVSSLSNSTEFKRILGYINTAGDKQHKGASGYVK